MEKFETKHFGEISYDPTRVIDFPEGIPGFPDSKRYLLMSEDENEDTFFWLQSIDEGDVAFTLMDVYKVLPDYDPQVEQDELAELGELDDTPLLIYNIVVIPDYIRHMRVNLRAPIVMNLNTGRGKQLICANDDYSIRFMIFEELERAKKKIAAEKQNAGSDA
ncbi:MAG: flagellar assembly protein FliW [Clostridiales bacterium]|jgi:flagellar assembly factor FliW|nr:flagellar assembly protein FliW [Clostridiales bacterium]